MCQSAPRHPVHLSVQITDVVSTLTKTTDTFVVMNTSISIFLDRKRDDLFLTEWFTVQNTSISQIFKGQPIKTLGSKVQAA